MRPEAAFAIPGNIQTRTGGYIYERRMLESLNALGQPTRHIELMTSWPHPTPEAENDLVEKLAALPKDMPLILDGLVFGAMDTAVLAAQNRPIIAMLHHPLGLEAGLAPDRAAELLEREAANLRHAAHVVVPSPHTRDILVRDFGVPAASISIALPGFDRPTLRAIPKACPPLILSVGIICQRKGHDILLDALAQVAHLDWQAVIVGMVHEADVQDRLLHQRARLGLEGRVRFTGVIPPEDLDQLYQQASIFALATRYEGYGMVLSEAQLYGLPVLSCTVGAVPQTVPPSSGILVPPDNAVAFAKSLATLLQDEALRQSYGAQSALIGARLPQWEDAARIMQRALQNAHTTTVPK
jgi:glycosyltransferase involved in cell wall biosynthesis